MTIILYVHFYLIFVININKIDFIFKEMNITYLIDGFRRAMESVYDGK